MAAQGGQGSLAVRTEGSGALMCVRLIHLIRGTVFWFKVDSAQPGLPPHAAPGSPLHAGAHGAVLKQEVRPAAALRAQSPQNIFKCSGLTGSLRASNHRLFG